MVGVSGPTVVTSLSLTGVGTNIGNTIAGCSASIASFSTLVTNEFFWKRKLSYTELKDWINFNAIPYENNLKKS